jgi:hypothetical protein
MIFSCTNSGDSSLIEGSGLSVTISHPGAEVECHPASLSLAFGLLKGTTSASFTIEGDVSVSLRGNEVIISGGSSILRLMFAPPLDAVGKAAPPSSSHISREDDRWVITLSLDNKWATSPVRKFPITVSVDVPLIPLRGIEMGALGLKMVGPTGGPLVDPREDSEIQWSVAFFDDEALSVPRPSFEGLQVISTVPAWAVSLSGDDLAAWENGIGFASRDIWIRILPSKMLPTPGTLDFDILLPGTSKSYAVAAERVGTVGGLPIYKGSFVVEEESPPAWVDGNGQIVLHP